MGGEVYVLLYDKTIRSVPEPTRFAVTDELTAQAWVLQQNEHDDDGASYASYAPVKVVEDTECETCGHDNVIRHYKGQCLICQRQCREEVGMAERAQVYFDLSGYHLDVPGLLAPVLESTRDHEFSFVVQPRQGSDENPSRQCLLEVLRDFFRTENDDYRGHLEGRLRVMTDAPYIPELSIRKAVLLSTWDRCSMTHPGDDW